MAGQYSYSNTEAGSDEEGQEDWSDTGWAQPINADLNLNLQSFTQHHDNNHHDGDTGITKQEIHDLKTEALNVLSSGKQTGVTRMGLNDNKAGMKGLDKERINQIIFEASKGSRFYENEKKKEEQMKLRILEQKVKVESLTEEQLCQGLIQADKLLEELKTDRKLDRYIVHIDMDAFYAAVEMRDNPSLRDKPMAVGGSSMLSTSNYHARRYGVRAAMPGFIGKKLCPELVIVPSNFEKYTAVSKLVRNILAEYDPNYSTMSLDEAYLDFTDHVQQRQGLEVKGRTFLARTNDHFDKDGCVCDPNCAIREWLLSPDGPPAHVLKHGNILDVNILLQESATDDDVPAELTGELCFRCNKKRASVRVEVFGLSVEEAVREMRFRIEQKTRLTASAGIAPNTMLAKVCSDYNKPNGQFRVLPTIEAVTAFVNNLPIRKVSGIGNVSEKMLNAVGVELCSHLYQKRALLYFLYSPISFNYFMRVCLGIGSTRIERDGERKSLSTERSFSEINKPADLFRKCEELCTALWEDIQQEQLMGKTVTLKLKTVGFEVRTRAQTLPDYTNSRDVILEAALDLLKGEIQACYPQPLRLRLMGVRLSTLLHSSHYSRQHQKTIKGMFKQRQTKQESDLGSIVSTVSANNVAPECSSLSAQSAEAAGLPTGTFSVPTTASTDSEPQTSHNDTVKLKTGTVFRENRLSSMSDSDSRSPFVGSASSLNMSASDALSLPEDKTKSESQKKLDDSVSQWTRQKRKDYAGSLLTQVPKKLAYTCPVCNKEVLTSGLNNMNKHVDKCLAKVNQDGAGADQTTISEAGQDGAGTDQTTISEAGQDDAGMDQTTISEAGQNGPCDGQTVAVEAGSSECDAFISSKFAKSALKNDTKSRLPSMNPEKLISEVVHVPKLPLCSNLSKEQMTDDCLGEISSSMSRGENLDREVNSRGQQNHDSDEIEESVCMSGDRNPVDRTDTLEPDSVGISNESESIESLQLQTERQRYRCPVCNIVLNVSLGRFNDHVDMCLNQPTISSILREPNQPSEDSKRQKRLSVDESSPVSAAKRKKSSNSPKSRSIMSYLKR
ncbi:DNA polymerase kappa-like [Liolophura sinensis]|uniref:DNA polymerase kappa-like n=1 Tax=Liolophura sinensis TaxID=3198878 RepID=UPI0031590E66